MTTELAATLLCLVALAAPCALVVLAAVVVGGRADDWRPEMTESVLMHRESE